jgi:hypothetical protein
MFSYKPVIYTVFAVFPPPSGVELGGGRRPIRRQQSGEAHLHRYLAEFDFRYNNRSALGIEDTERATKAIRGAEGKRLMYAQPR